MKRIARIAVAIAAAFALTSTALAATPAEQAAPQEFSALQGLDAQALDAVEMDAIHGALTGQEIFDALLARAQLIKDPVLRAKTIAALTANQTQLVAFFNKLLSFRR
jgi:hypothetical protein